MHVFTCTLNIILTWSTTDNTIHAVLEVSYHNIQNVFPFIDKLGLRLTLFYNQFNVCYDDTSIYVQFDPIQHHEKNFGCRKRV